nr:class I SAM-dependent methyltransferase [Actinomycetes bacterium]
RLFMFEFGRHNVNGIQIEGLPADNFERLLPAAGWHLDYLGETTYQANFSPETFEGMSAQMNQQPELAERMKPLQDRLRIIAPLLENYRVNMPFWSVTATRQD